MREGGKVKRLLGILLIVASLVTVGPATASAATVEERLAALEQRVVQLERALSLTKLDVPGLVKLAAPSVVSIYMVDDTDDVLSQGTGFIVSKEGMIFTNAHVINKSGTIKVKLNSGTVVQGQMWLIDPFLDLGVIDIPGTSHPALTLVDTKPQVGDPVVVIGNAWGYSNSVTTGVVSGVDRPDPYHSYHYPSLQTDAAINHGNSGGPILNAQGQVIAMATWAELKDETEGIAFGIPGDQIWAQLRKLDDKRGIVRPWLGISAQEPYWARGGLPNSLGLMVTGVHPKGTAFAAGIKPYDFIQKLNGVAINYLMDFRRELDNFKPGDTVTLTITRQNSSGRYVAQDVKVRLGEYSLLSTIQIPVEYEPRTDDVY